MRRIVSFLAGAAAVALLGGCAAPIPSNSPSPVDLVAARKAAGIADCPPSAPKAEAVKDGLPTLELSCLGGDSKLTLSTLRGPLLINLWAQWCLPCRQEAAALRDFHAKRGDIALLGINYDDPDPALAIEFAQYVGWTWPQLVDQAKAAAEPLGVPGLPLSLLIASDGRVVARHAGPFKSAAEIGQWADQGLGK